MRRPGQEIFIIGQGDVGLEPVHQVPQSTDVPPGLTPDLKGAHDRGEHVHFMAPDDRGRIGALLHLKFPPQDRGPGAVADEEKLVFGEVPGNGQGPDCVPVSGAVDPIENFGHNLTT